MKRPQTRRQYLQGSALAGLMGLAGCLSAGNSGQAVGGDPQVSDTTASTEPLEDWLADANGYDGSTRRYSQRDRPTVFVGESIDGELAFAPPVIEVPPQTTVRWDWTGHGGQHNVVALDGTFDSGRTNAQPGTGYHYFFDDPGEYRYVSEPHRDDGMKGVVIVSEPPSTGNEVVDEWVVDSSNFDGTIVDETDAGTATVAVGVPGNGGHFAFGPPVLKVTTGTTVEWEWTDAGGPHSVAFQELDIESGEVVAEPGVNFEHTFETTGTYLYACTPHRSLGMKGAIIVE